MLFRSSPKTVYLWVKLYKEEQILEAKKNYQKGHSHAIKDLKSFEDVLKNNNFSTIEEIKQNLMNNKFDKRPEYTNKLNE